MGGRYAGHVLCMLVCIPFAYERLLAVSHWKGQGVVCAFSSCCTAVRGLVMLRLIPCGDKLVARKVENCSMAL